MRRVGSRVDLYGPLKAPMNDRDRAVVDWPPPVAAAPAPRPAARPGRPCLDVTLPCPSELSTASISFQNGMVRRAYPWSSSTVRGVTITIGMPWSRTRP